MHKIAEKRRWLKNQNVRSGDRIALQMPPSKDWVSLFLAALELGAALCPLPVKAPPEPFLKQLQPKLWIDASGTPHSMDQSPLLLPESSVLLFTSGSSGIPKIAIFKLDQLLTSAKAVVHALSIHPTDCLHLSLPLHHVGGIGIIFRSLISKASIAFSRDDPKISILSQVPTQLYRAWPVLPRLRAILLGGAPIFDIPEKLPIYATYGLTEMGSTVLLKRHPPKLHNHFYLGSPLPHAQMKLAPDGEILVSGKSLFMGYLNENQIVSPGEWFATKDLGAFDPVEGFAILGRKDNLFISGGENIQPEEIERALLQHPAILEAIVVPKQDLEFGMRPVACIHASKPLLLHEIQAFLQERLPKYKIPVALEKLPPAELKHNRKKIFESVNRSS